MSFKHTFVLALSGLILLARQVAGTGCCTTSPCKPAPDDDKCPDGSSFVYLGTCDKDVCKPPGIYADPVLRGFDGSTFDFFGQSGFNYSLLATTDLAINMQLVPAGPLNLLHPGGEGTFVGAAGIFLPAFELLAYADEAGNMTFTVNGESVDIELPNSWPQVEYEPYVPILGQTITVTQPPFNIKLIAVKSYTETASGYNRGHFDLQVQSTGRAASSVSGVLGQTLGAFDLAGMNATTFEVPSLGFYRFEEPRSFSRRLLSADLHDYPLYASLG